MCQASQNALTLQDKFSDCESTWKTIFEIYNIITIIRICHAKRTKQYSKTILLLEYAFVFLFYNFSLIHCTPKGADGDFRRKLYTNGFSVTDNLLHSLKNTSYIFSDR